MRAAKRRAMRPAAARRRWSTSRDAWRRRSSTRDARRRGASPATVALLAVTPSASRFWPRSRMASQLQLVGLPRRKLMSKTDKRRKIAEKWHGKIIVPSAMSELNKKTRGLDVVLERIDDTTAEIREQKLGGKRHIVDIEARTCTCKSWQVSGKSCEHALCFITSIRTLKIENFIDECYSMRKFAAAYAHRIPGLTDTSQWPKDTHDFYLYPSILRRSAGRQKKQRFKGGLEGRGRNGQHRCQLCFGYGHRWKNCKQTDPEAKEAYALLPKKRPKKKGVSTSQFVPIGDASASVSTVQVSSMALVPPVPIAEVSTPEKRRKRKSREPASPDSPAMSTRSKKLSPHL